MTSIDRPDSDHAVLRPFTVGQLALANRVIVAPMSRVSAGTSGVPTKQMSDYYAAFAAGRFGAVVTEGIYTDTDFARSYAHQPGLTNSDQQAGWASVVAAVHEQGVPIIAQLMHGGALSQCLSATIGPSAVGPLGRKLSDYGGEGPFEIPAAATCAQLGAAVSGFVDAAERALNAGFDGVEVHAANGYLLDQFITTYTNQRTDDYGGSPVNRIRLTAEVVDAIRAGLDRNFLVGVRLSQTKVNDPRYRWDGIDEATTYFAAMAEAGADYLHIASEGRDWRHTAMLSDSVTITGLARSVTGLPVIANGGLHRVNLANQVLSDGDADLVALAGGALANPDWPERVRRGAVINEPDHRLLRPSADLDHAPLSVTAGTGDPISQ